MSAITPVAPFLIGSLLSVRTVLGTPCSSVGAPAELTCLVRFRWQSSLGGIVACLGAIYFHLWPYGRDPKPVIKVNRPTASDESSG